MQSLENDTIEIHNVDLDVAAATLARRKGFLTAAEIARAERFVSDRHTRRWIACRGRLRELLAQHTGGTPGALEFAEVANGKPVVAGPAGTGLYFNVSHAHEQALVAITRLAPVGVDIEFLQRLSDWPAIAKRFFAKEEVAELMALPAAQQREGFFCCWTRKEAVIKATGEGLGAKLDAFSVSLTPGAAATVNRHADGGPWHLLLPTVPRGYVGALAIRSDTLPRLRQVRRL